MPNSLKVPNNSQNISLEQTNTLPLQGQSCGRTAPPFPQYSATNFHRLGVNYERPKSVWQMNAWSKCALPARLAQLKPQVM